jgi:branched-subunit amino acid aminotransferase/4-amino-4-deoxychorismate lyase
VSIRILYNGSLVENLPWPVTGQGGFFYGRRVMTTLLKIGNRLVDFQRHFERMSHDAEQMGIGDLGSPDSLAAEILSLATVGSAEPRQKARIIFFEDANQRLSRIVTVESIDDSVNAMTPLKLMTVTDRFAARGSAIKTGHLGSRATQIHKLRGSGFDDILWLNGDGELTECAWANVFLIGRTGDLVEIATPPESSGILPGITRRRVMDLLTAARIPVTVRPITLDEIPRFDEAFVTSSIQCLRPVAAIGRHQLHTERAKSVFTHIARLYSTWLSLENDYDHFEVKAPVQLM